MREPLLVVQEECGGVEVGGGLGPVHADEGVPAVKPAARLYQPRDVAQLQLVGVVSPPRLVVPLQKYCIQQFFSSNIFYPCEIFSHLQFF